MGKGRRYDQDYKDMIVDLFKSGMSVSEIISEYGIAKSTINGWIKDVKEIKVDENEVMTLKEVKELKKEMADNLGSQYTSNDLRDVCKEFSIIQSFSKKGCPYDNACIESFHSSIKREEVYRNTYRIFEEAKVAIFKYIEEWYNRKRLHSAITYMTPEQCELLARSVS